MQVCLTYPPYIPAQWTELFWDCPTYPRNILAHRTELFWDSLLPARSSDIPKSFSNCFSTISSTFIFLLSLSSFKYVSHLHTHLSLLFFFVRVPLYLSCSDLLYEKHLSATEVTKQRQHTEDNVHLGRGSLFFVCFQYSQGR